MRTVLEIAITASVKRLMKTNNSHVSADDNDNMQ